VLLTDLIPSGSREEAAKAFYDALVLQSKGLILIAQQTKPFDTLQLELVDAQ
jgi:hypothetical protein